MADLSDVENTIVNLISGLVYPNGTGNPSIVLNDAGSPMTVRVYPGWPVPANLDADLAAGVINISVFSQGKTGHNTTRFPYSYQDGTPEVATVAASINASNQIVVTGAGAAGITQWISVVVGIAFATSYSVLATDTATTIATALAAALTAGGIPASSSVGTITITGGAPLMTVHVGVTVPQTSEIARERVNEQITIWAPTPISRSNAAKVIDPPLKLQTFLTMPDNFLARFRYFNTITFDGAEKVALYRRDILYQVEYATTAADTGYEVTTVNSNIDSEPGGIGTAATKAPFYAPVGTGPAPITQYPAGVPPVVPGPPIGPTYSAPTGPQVP